MKSTLTLPDGYEFHVAENIDVDVTIALWYNGTTHLSWQAVTEDCPVDTAVAVLCDYAWKHYHETRNSEIALEAVKQFIKEKKLPLRWEK